MVKNRERYRTDFPKPCPNCQVISYNKNHWKQHKKSCLNMVKPVGFEETSIPVLPLEPLQVFHNEEKEEEEEREMKRKSPEDFNEDIKKFSFNLKKRLNMEETQIEYILDFVGSTMQQSLLHSYDKNFVSNFLQRSFFRLETKYLRENSYNSSCCCVPIKIEQSPFSYLPIKSQVVHLLESSETARIAFSTENVLKSPTTRDDDVLMESILDGALSQRILQDISTDYVVPIILFFDEFCEVCPIGPFVENNKMAVFQWQAVSRQMETDCFILALGKSTDLKGGQGRKVEMLNSAIMQLMMDLGPTTLKDGSTVEIVMVAFVADNLAQHQVGALLESFSATFPCSRCLLLKVAFSTTFNEDEMLVRRRTLILTRKQIASIIQAKGKEKAKLIRNSGLVGVYPAVMNLPRIGLHFPDFFPTELMHDIFQD